MLKKIVNKIKSKKTCLQRNVIYNIPIREEPCFEINISKENDIFRIQISDYISLLDYVERMKLLDTYGIDNLISNGVLWNSRKQKVNSGTYYIITVNGRLYNILINSEVLKIDERTQKSNITKEKIISFYVNNSDFRYFSCKHDETGNTFYTRYYGYNGLDLGNLELSNEETYKEINSIIYNLENAEKICNILDLNLLKRHILDDLKKTSIQRKKTL